MCDRRKQGRKINPFKDVFVVVVENDTGDFLRGNGPMIWETYTGRADLLKAVDRAEALAGRYGKTIICRLEEIGTPDDCKKFID